MALADLAPRRQGGLAARSVPHGARAAVLWLVRMLAIIIPVFLLATTITFLLGSLSGLSPAGAILGDSATPEDIIRVSKEFGLDRPVVVQYFDWLGGILRGDLGTSWFNNFSVSALIAQRLGVSLSVAGLALVLGVVFGTLLGTLAAVYRGRAFDRIVTAVASVMSTVPAFLVGIVLIIVFCVVFPIFPSAGYVDPTVNLGRWLSLITLPAIALSFDTTAEITRQLRTGLVSAYQQNYVTGAIVRGLSPRRILWVHVLRNGAGPALAVVGLHVPRLIGGAVITESVFGMPGFGRLAAESALRGDVPVVQGALVVAIALVLVSSLLVNGALARLSPTARGGR
jgi:peptide/nickel transport system permease protein